MNGKKNKHTFKVRSIKKLSGRYTIINSMVDSERNKQKEEYLENKVTDKPIIRIINIQHRQFTEEEFNVVLTKIKSRKAASFDETVQEVWKIRKLDNLLLRLCNDIYI